MKGKSVLILVALLIVTILMGTLSYFGIGEKNLFGVQNIRQGLDLSGGVYIVYEALKDNPTNEEMSTTIALIRDRLDRRGYTEAEVARQGEKRIRVDIPGVEDANQAVDEIGRTAQLQFVDPEGNVILTGADVSVAKKDVGATYEGGPAEPYVTLEFNAQGTKAFAEATAKFKGQQIAIMLDDGIVSAPVVNSEIANGKAIISGSFTADSAEELAALIRAGSLPFNLGVLEMNGIGAKLGANALNTSLLAGAIGVGLVLAFMLFMYRIPGLAADWALLFYIALVLLILSTLNVTLTLPGIAGIILSIGMAVDANVIIFARIREELQAGKTLRASVDAGFAKAFSAIIDGNVTTLIAAVVLFWLGTGPIKGFAQTLGIGIISSMFTALVITKIILKQFVQIGLKNPRLYGGK